MIHIQLLLLFVLGLIAVSIATSPESGTIGVPLGASNSSLPEEAFFKGTDNSKCKICEIDCLPKDMNLFYTCKFKYFHYGCHEKSYCIRADSFNMEQSFAATLICATFNGCEFNLPQNDKRTLFERLNVYKLYVEDYKKFGLDIALDQYCNPNYGLDTTKQQCKDANFAENYKNYEAYTKDELKKYFEKLGGYNTDTTELKRRAFVSLGVPPTFYFFFKILQDFKDGIVTNDPTYEKTIQQGINKYLNFYASVGKGVPFAMSFSIKNFVDACKQQIKENQMPRLQQIWALVEEYVKQKVETKNNLDTTEARLAKLGVTNLPPVEGFDNSNTELSSTSNSRFNLMGGRQAEGSVGEGNIGELKGAVLPKENPEITALKNKRAELIRIYYQELEDNLVADYKAMWESWTLVQLNRYFVDVVVYGIPGVKTHKSLEEECPANSNLFDQDNKKGFCCVGTLAQYDSNMIYRKCLGEVICAITPGNKNFKGCNGVIVSPELAAKYPGKITWPVIMQPQSVPQNSETAITVDQWWLSTGNKYRGLDQEPSREVIEKVSGPLSWTKHNSPVVRIDVNGAECMWKDSIGMYAFGYVWVPQQGTVTLRVTTDDDSWVLINDQLVVADKCCGTQNHDISSHAAVKRGGWNKVYAVGAEGCYSGYLGVQFILLQIFPVIAPPNIVPSNSLTQLSFQSFQIATGPAYFGFNREPSSIEIEQLSPPLAWKSAAIFNNRLQVSVSSGLSCFWRNLAGMYIVGYVWVPANGEVTLVLSTDDVSYLSINDKFVVKGPCCGDTRHEFNKDPNLKTALTRGAWNKISVVGADGCGHGIVAMQWLYTN